MHVLVRTVALSAVTVLLGGLTAVTAGSVAAAAPRKVPALTAKQAAFLAKAAGPARASQRRYGIPASVTIAQAVLESGWGRSALALSANNYFGMTCGPAGPGVIATGCRLGPDRICDRRGCRASVAAFRAYRSPADSFRDHGRVLSTTPRYARAYAHRGNPDRFIVEVHRAGYATDPRYAALIHKIMAKYDLYRYNR